jgi:multiple sugar transport system substrate-binding protein
MEGDIIFNKEKPTNITPPSANEKVSPSPPASQPSSPPPPPQSNLASTPLPPPPRPSIISLLLKIVIGIGMLIVLGFVGVRFVLPMFSSNGNEKVTLTYWGLWESEKTMAAVINEFQRENPNITVKYSRQDIKQYNDTLQTRIKNGTGPDIFRYHSTWVPMLREELLPLSQDAIKPDDFKKKYYPVVSTDVMKNGAIYGIPLGIDTLAMFVNTEITKEAGVSVPTDWNEFVKSAIKITVKDSAGKIKTAGAALGTYDNITHAPDILGMLFVQNGTDLTDMSKTPTNASETLQFYTSFASGNGKMWDETLDESIKAFTKGQVGFYFGYSWDVFQIRAMNPELKFEVHKVPGLPGRRTTVASYWVEGVSLKTKHPKEAMLFMNFLSKESTVEKIYAEASKSREFGEPYPMVGLKDRLKDNKVVYPFVDQAATAKSTYFVSNTYDNGINDKMNAYLGNAVRASLGNTSPQTAVETLSQGITQVLSLYERKPTPTR